MRKLIKGIKLYLKEAFKPEFSHYKAGNLWGMILIPIVIIVWIFTIFEKYF